MQCHACIADARRRNTFTSLDECEGLLDQMLEVLGPGRDLFEPPEEQEEEELDLPSSSRRTDSKLIERFTKLYAEPIQSDRRGRRSTLIGIEKIGIGRIRIPSDISEGIASSEPGSDVSSAEREWRSDVVSLKSAIL